MYTKINYTIKSEKKFADELKSESIDFQIRIDEEDNTDSYSFNPNSGWTQYDGFMDGWSEQDPDLNELLEAIHDYSSSEELFNLVCESVEEDIGNEYVREYEYKYATTINDVEVDGEK